MHILRGKKIAVFGTGASPVRHDTLVEVRDQNFSTEDLKHLRYFYLRGGFNYDKLPWVQKVLMILLKWKIQLKKRLNMPLVGDEIGMLHAYDKPADFTNKKNVEELIVYMREPQ